MLYCNYKEGNHKRLPDYKLKLFIATAVIIRSNGGYLRLSDNVLRHRKPPRNFGERKGGVSIFHILRGQPTLWAVALLVSQI